MKPLLVPSLNNWGFLAVVFKNFLFMALPTCVSINDMLHACFFGNKSLIVYGCCDLTHATFMKRFSLAILLFHKHEKQELQYYATDSVIAHPSEKNPGFVSLWEATHSIKGTKVEIMSSAPVNLLTLRLYCTKQNSRMGGTNTHVSRVRSSRDHTYPLRSFQTWSV